MDTLPKYPVVPNKLHLVENYTDNFIPIDDTKFNYVVCVRNIVDSIVRLESNQKIRKLIITDCVNTNIQVLDSVVVGTRTCEIMNCKNCIIMFDHIDLRTVWFYNCVSCTIQFSLEPILYERLQMFWSGSVSNKIQTQQIIPGHNPDEVQLMLVDILETFQVPPSADPPQTLLIHFLPDLKGIRAERVSEGTRSAESLVTEIARGVEDNKIYDMIPVSERERWELEERAEYMESDVILEDKAKVIAEELRKSTHTVVYTGAGVSTSAMILDYRGPDGMWTTLARGEEPKPKIAITDARPTYCHYALTELVRRGIVKFIVSTNVDGLHLRSGTPITSLSELHGNLYREYCLYCGLDHFRVYNTITYDWSHLTGRTCDRCGGPLKDTQVGFTESPSPTQWGPACTHAMHSDVALVLGTSMNVQSAAALPERALMNKGKLFIVNLQHTPYDELASIRVFTKTDKFLEMIMKHLGIVMFDMEYDFLEVLKSKCVVVEEKKGMEKEKKNI